MLGFSPFWADQAVPFGQWNYDFLPRADFISLHADDFFGIPFEAFATTSAPTNLPPSWVAKWDAFAMPAVSSGRPILLSVSPLADRSRLIKRVLSDGGVQDGWDPVDAGVNGSLCYSFFESDTPAIATAYVNSIEWLITRYHPSQVAIAIEADIQFYKCPAQKEAFKNFLRLVRSVVAANHPGMPVFMTFSLENFYANGLAGSLNGCGPLSPSACFDTRVDEVVSLTGDAGIGLSTYPQGWFPRTAAMPADRFARIRARTTQPLWVTETGWATVPVRFTYASGTCGDPLQSYYDSTIANEQTQRAAVTETLTLAADAGVTGVVWWLHRDYLDETAASACPCAPAGRDTCSRIALFGSAEFFYRSFGNMGLVRQNGTAKPAAQDWDAFRQRAYVP
ncbi:MAG: hypothetical protein GQE15_05380 [Archangiaceae bacterium]|nr:hypothetical protein [Archangiaceae bacterium]